MPGPGPGERRANSCWYLWEEGHNLLKDITTRLIRSACDGHMYTKEGEPLLVPVGRRAHVGILCYTRRSLLMGTCWHFMLHKAQPAYGHM